MLLFRKYVCTMKKNTMSNFDDVIYPPRIVYKAIDEAISSDIFIPSLYKFYTIRSGI